MIGNCDFVNSIRLSHEMTRASKSLAKCKEMEQNEIDNGSRYIKIAPSCEILVSCNEAGIPTQKGIELINNHEKIIQNYNTQVEIDNGFVVLAFFELKGEIRERWHKLRNFGDRLNDAIEYRNDVAYINYPTLCALAKRYNNNVKYERINRFRFKKQ